MVRIEPTTMVTSPPVAVPHYPRRIEGASSGLWLTGEQNEVTQIVSDGTVGDVIRLRSWIGGLASDASGVWVSNPDEHVLRRIERGRVVRTVDLDDAVSNLAIGPNGWLWATARTGVVAYDVSR